MAIPITPDNSPQISRDQIKIIVAKHGDKGNWEPLTDTDMEALEMTTFIKKRYDIDDARPNSETDLQDQRLLDRAMASLTLPENFNYIELKMMQSEALVVRCLIAANKLEPLVNDYVIENYADEEVKPIDDQEDPNSKENEEARENMIDKTWSTIFATNENVAQEDLIINIATDAVHAFLVSQNTKNNVDVGRVTYGAEYEFCDSVFNQVVDYLRLNIPMRIKGNNTSMHERLRQASLKFREISPAPAIASEDQLSPYHAQYEANSVDETPELVSRVEIKTKPTSRRLELWRDWLQLRKANLLSDNLSIHETYGNLKLDVDNTQVMDVRSFATAAGLYDRNAYSDKEQAKLYRETGESPIINDSFQKLVRQGEGVYYYPLFKPREATEMQAVGDTQITEGVEFRALPNMRSGDWDSFYRHVKRKTYQDLACEAIAATQMPEEARTPQEQERVVIYQNHVGQMRDLFREYGEDILPDDDKVIRVDTDPELAGMIRTNPSGSMELDWQEVKASDYKFPYTHHLTRVRLLAAENPEFKQRANSLIIEFRKQMKATFV